MIIFVEERAGLGKIYEGGFLEIGESINQMGSSDFMSWLNTSEYSDFICAEAILIGETDCADKIIHAVRNKLNVPIISLLDKRCLFTLTRHYKLGVDDVVIKPIHKEELRFRIGAVKRRILVNSRATSEKQNARLTVFFDGRDPEYDGTAFPLPRRERRILEYLATVRGRRVSRRQIFDAVYGILDETTDETTVESHISKLRKKLRKLVGFDPIDSKRFLGYRLDPLTVCVSSLTPPAQVA